MSASQEQQSSHGTARLKRAAHLRDAIVLRSRERQHSAADIARVLGMSIGHWYRIRKDPLRLGRIDLERVNAIARYVGWFRLQVLVAIGWVHQEELHEILVGDAAVEQALDRLRRHALANDLATPLERAAPDHQRLIARLVLAAELRSTTRIVEAD